MQEIIIQSVAIIGLLLVLLGCRERVTDGIADFAQVPVVNSFLVADSLVKVHVSLAGKMDLIPLTVVDGATVSCFINDSVSEVLKPVGDGYYMGKTRVKTGTICRINVLVPGFDEISASDTIPGRVSPTRIEHVNFAAFNEEGQFFPAVRITFPVDQKKVQYFQVTLRLFHTEHSVQSEYHHITYLIDYSDPVFLAEGMLIPVFSSDKIRDTTYTLQMNYGSATIGWNDPVTYIRLVQYYPLVVEFKTISFQYYQYLKQLYLYNTGRYPEFQFGSYKAFPLFSNVSNGMGVVAGCAVYRSEVITPEPWRR
ncbi:MAG: DUF4249 domain-containing protein [Bacteroidales bacterium]